MNMKIIAVLLVVVCPCVLVSCGACPAGIMWSNPHAGNFRSRVSHLHDSLTDTYGENGNSYHCHNENLSKIRCRCYGNMRSINCKAQAIRRLHQYESYIQHLSNHVRQSRARQLRRINNSLRDFTATIENECREQARAAGNDLRDCELPRVEISRINRSNSGEWNEDVLCILHRVRTFLDDFSIGITHEGK